MGHTAMHAWQLTQLSSITPITGVNFFVIEMPLKNEFEGDFDKKRSPAGISFCPVNYAGCVNRLGNSRLCFLRRGKKPNENARKMALPPKKSANWHNDGRSKFRFDR
jgi:hypothetical protein